MQGSYSFVLFPVVHHILSKFCFKSDYQCKIAEQQDSETICIKLCYARNKTCKDMPQLCIDITSEDDAGEDITGENSITLDVINKVENFSFVCFENLGQHVVDGVRVLLLSLSS
jgi:hypothetical protein